MNEKITELKDKVNLVIKDIKEKGVEGIKIHMLEVGIASFIVVVLLNIFLSFILGGSTTNGVNNKVRNLTNDSNSKGCIQMQKVITNYESSDNEGAKAYIEDAYKEAIKYVEQYCK